MVNLVLKKKSKEQKKSKIKYDAAVEGNLLLHQRRCREIEVDGS